jgi:hypothetical protein
MGDQVQPGPCPPTGCPAPTEIDCIVVTKVYASCVQTVTTSGQFTVTDCTGPVTCNVDLSSSTCTVGAITPTGTDDINNVTYIVGLVLDLTCANGVLATETLYTTVTVPLYNPAGTYASCTILSASCNCVLLPNGLVSCNVNACVLAQTTAVVQLLVPTYGFCSPEPCAVGPLLPCPPSPLFPPQQN